MRISKPVWCAGLLGVAVAVSGFVWLPAPLDLARRELARRSPVFELTGKARMRWATGEIRVREVRLRWGGAELGAAEWVEVRTDLRPWRRHADPVARVSVHGLSADLDLARLAALRGPERPMHGAFDALEIRLADARVTWTAPDGRRYSAEGIGGRMVAAFDAENLFRIGVEGSGHLTAPVAADLRLRLSADPLTEEWESSISLAADEIPPPAVLGWDAGGLAWSAASAAARVHLTATEWRVEASAALRNVSHPESPIPLAALQVSIAGDARRLLRAQADASTPHGGVQLRASAEGGGADWNYTASAEVRDLALDARLREVLDRRSSPLSDLLASLGLNGNAVASLRADGAIRGGVATPPEICAYAPGAGLGLRYAGFADPETGERFSCTLPIAVTGGGVAYAYRTLLVLAQGAVGESDADPHGSQAAGASVIAAGVVTLEEPQAQAALDLRVERLQVGPRLAEALAENLEIARIWQEIGAPRAEAADVTVRVRPDGVTHRVRVRATVAALRAQPLRLGSEVEVRDLTLDLSEGRVALHGAASTGGLSAIVRAEGRAILGRPDAFAWACTAEGEGLPDPEALATWAREFALPQQTLAVTARGDASWQVGLRFDADGAGAALAPPSVAGRIAIERGAADWEEQQLSLAALVLTAGVAAGAGGALVGVASASGEWSGGALRAGGGATILAGGGFAPQDRVAVSLRGAALEDAQLRRVLALLGVETWTERVRVSGRISGNLDLPLLAPAAATARVDLEPLILNLPPGALQRAARRAAADFRLQGTLLSSGGTLRVPRLSLTGSEVDLVLEDCSGAFDAAGLRLKGRVNSVDGMRLRPPLSLVAPQPLLDALDQIGVDGRITPQDLAFELELPVRGTPLVRARGAIGLEQFRLLGPPPVENGEGTVVCEEFTWRGPDDFRGRFLLTDGRARVADVGVRSGTAALHLSPDQIVVTGFLAEALGGRVMTDWTDAEGVAQHGAFALGLAGRATVRAEFRFEEFLLERLGEELGFRGPLAGRLDGLVKVASADPSPVNYRGQVVLGIRDGILGTVPVLAQIWRLVGVEPPTFSKGALRMSFLGEGRVLIEELSLTHPLLEVTGERMLTIDSYLRLKVTVRTLGFFGRLPLIRDLLDWFVEHDVYGPAASPRLRQRGFGKLFHGDPDRVPFRLWVPAVPRPDWRVSPALPVVPDAAPLP
jgi:hypothetical protein